MYINNALLPYGGVHPLVAEYTTTPYFLLLTLAMCQDRLLVDSRNTKLIQQILHLRLLLRKF